MRKTHRHRELDEIIRTAIRVIVVQARVEQDRNAAAQVVLLQQVAICGGQRMSLGAAAEP